MDVVEMRYFVPWLGGGTMSNRGMGSNPKNGAPVSGRLLLHKKILKDVVSKRYTGSPFKARFKSSALVACYSFKNKNERCRRIEILR
jgi:hypothetical protein